VCYGVQEGGTETNVKKKWDVLAGSQQQAAKDQSPAKHAISFTKWFVGKIEKELESIISPIDIQLWWWYNLASSWKQLNYW
jgi:hypothetical protein